MKKLLLTSLLVIGLAAGLSGVAYAIPCGNGGVSGSTDCQDGIANNDKVAPTLTVNDESFFGFDDWVFLSKQEFEDGVLGDLEEPVDIDLLVTATTAATGTWAFNPAIWGDAVDIMIVLKDGIHKLPPPGPAGDVFFSGYLLDNVAQPSSGTWDTGGKGLSHLTVYGRGASIPEPTTILLLGTGFIGLGIWGRRRFRTKS